MGPRRKAKSASKQAVPSRGPRAVLTLCPCCGGKVVPIEYGLPTGDEDLIERAQRRAVISGGCVVPPDEPDRGCVQCGQWFKDGEPSGYRSIGWPNPPPN